MAGKDEISSTEKLLDLIREDSDNDQEPSDYQLTRQLKNQLKTC